MYSLSMEKEDTVSYAEIEQAEDQTPRMSSNPQTLNVLATCEVRVYYKSPETSQGPCHEDEVGMEMKLHGAVSR